MTDFASTQHRLVPRAEPSLLGIWTLVVWLLCCGVGMLGWVMKYERPRPPAAPIEAVVVRPLTVELASTPSVPEHPAPAPVLPATVHPPPAPEPVTLPSVPRLIPVDAPGPAFLFPTPARLDLPARPPSPPEIAGQGAVTTKAGSSAPSPESSGVAATPETLVFGQGPGKQPAPDYPRQAVRQGQEGKVLVRLSVNPQGSVDSAYAVTPSAWPLLNQAAVRTVRERWRFPAGPPRLYEVLIRFQLAH